MARRESVLFLFVEVLALAAALPANAQSFRVQCPSSTITHPDPSNTGVNNSEPAYNGPTQFNAPTLGVPAGTTGAFVTPVPGTVNGAIKCQQVSGGDGFATMADGTQTFMFAFGPLSGLADIAAGHPGTEPPNVFNVPYPGTFVRGDPATTDGATMGNMPWTGFPGSYAPGFNYNGAVGLAPDVVQTLIVSDLVEGSLAGSGGTAGTCTTEPHVNHGYRLHV